MIEGDPSALSDAAHAATEEALSASYRTVFDALDEAFCVVEMILDDEGAAVDYRFVEVNRAFEDHTGLRDVRGRTVREALPIEPHWIETFGQVLRSGEPIRFIDEVASMRRWFDVYAWPLGHRLMFEDKLREAVASAERHGRPFAVLFLDLDGFKAINDDLGHASGDVVLIEVARRLRRSLRASDMLARIHGDEFVVILPEMSETHEAGSLAQKLLHVVSDRIDVANTTVRVQASIGVALYPNDAANPRALLRAADTAMYQAKLKGKNAVSYLVVAPDGGSRTGEPA